MKFGNPSCYKILITQVRFCLFISTFEILSNPPNLICSCFKLLPVNVSVCFTPLLGVALNACSKVYIHVVIYCVVYIHIIFF